MKLHGISFFVFFLKGHHSGQAYTYFSMKILFLMHFAGFNSVENYLSKTHDIS